MRRHRLDSQLERPKMCSCEVNNLEEAERAVDDRMDRVGPPISSKGGHRSGFGNPAADSAGTPAGVQA